MPALSNRNWETMETISSIGANLVNADVECKFSESRNKFTEIEVQDPSDADDEHGLHTNTHSHTQLLTQKMTSTALGSSKLSKANDDTQLRC